MALCNPRMHTSIIKSVIGELWFIHWPANYSRDLIFNSLLAAFYLKSQRVDVLYFFRISQNHMKWTRLRPDRVRQPIQNSKDASIFFMSNNVVDLIVAKPTQSKLYNCVMWRRTVSGLDAGLIKIRISARNNDQGIRLRACLVQQVGIHFFPWQCAPKFANFVNYKLAYVFSFLPSTLQQNFAELTTSPSWHFFFFFALDNVPPSL